MFRPSKGWRETADRTRPLRATAARRREPPGSSSALGSLTCRVLSECESSAYHRVHHASDVVFAGSPAQRKPGRHRFESNGDSRRTAAVHDWSEPDLFGFDSVRGCTKREIPARRVAVEREGLECGTRGGPPPLRFGWNADLVGEGVAKTTLGNRYYYYTTSKTESAN
jgi:hypothetical protein